MPRPNFMKILPTLLFVCVAIASAFGQTADPSSSVKLQVLHNFTGGSDGSRPMGGLIADSQGNLYGTTPEGGSSTTCNGFGCGTVFELSPPAPGGSSWTETILYRFTGGSDGAAPWGLLVTDKSGNFYGVANGGGQLNGSLCVYNGTPYGCGVIFELSPPSVQGGSWTETTLYSFLGQEGAFPNGTLVFDKTGNIYGTTAGGGSLQASCNTNGIVGCGVVFELSPPSAQGGAWTFADLYEFLGQADGGLPEANLILDTKGDLYGTTCELSGYLNGTAFELTPPAAGGAWSEQVLFSPGVCLQSPLAFDSQGNLYGTADHVFELSPSLGGGWTQTWLGLSGPPFKYPYGGIVFDREGNIYGTESAGTECGGVFRLQKSTDWSESLYSFYNIHKQPCVPEAPVTLGGSNVIYTTTVVGGSADLGTVISITP